MNSFVPTTNPSFTSQEHWGTEAETSTRVPKRKADQVAKTSQGRSMQCAAEERVTEIDNQYGSPYERAEGESCREQILSLLGDHDVLSVSMNGSVSINPQASSVELSALRDGLLDIKLPTNPEKREKAHAKISELLDLVQNKIAPVHEKAETSEVETSEADVKTKVERAKEGLMKALERLGELRAPISMRARKMRKMTEELKRLKRNRDTIRERAKLQTERDLIGSELNNLNQLAVLTALEALNELEQLRASNPDSLIDLAYEQESFQNSQSPVSKTLVQFVRTHNSFSFSPQAAKELAEIRVQEFDDGQPAFATHFFEAYNAPKKEDDPISFVRETTGIPSYKLDKVIQHALSN